MSLQLILGNSGSGKSHFLYEKIIKASLEQPGKRFFVIVPEQFTLQTQKELVMQHPAKGILNIDVLSFQRLAYRIFEEVGGDTRTVLEETGKNLLLRKIAGEKKEELQILGSNLKKAGYISQMKSMISELTQYDVGPEELETMIESAKDKPQLYYKLQDVKVLYEAFMERLHSQYITAEEILEALCQVVEDSQLLKDSVMVFDCFTGFTPIQQKLLKKLFVQAEEILVTLTIDAREDVMNVRGVYELFYLTKKTVKGLYKLAQETGTEILDPVVLGKGENPRFVNSPALGFLEQNFLRYHKQEYKKEQQEISIHVSKNPVEEAHFAARRILDLVRKEGLRYQDIGVITGDMASYAPYVKKVFALYGIPVFVDETKAVLLNPCLEFIRAALEAVSRDFPYESMFRYLRTGLCGVTREETDLLENYVLAFGIRGAGKWSRPWERTSKKFDQELLAECNRLREQVIAPLLPFRKVLKGKDTTLLEKTKALYELLKAQNIQQQMADQEARFLAQGKPEEAKEYSQIYGLVLELLDKAAELLGEEILSLKEYTEILEAGFSEVKVGNIPPAADRALVGDIQRTRLKDIRVLFFLGLNDGWVPKAGKNGGLLSEMEREMLEEAGASLAPTAREEGYIQRFYLYLNLTKPRERLYLSYSRSSVEGKALRPSYLIGHVAGLFPGLSVCEEDREEGAMTRIRDFESGIPCLIQGLQNPEEEDFLELYQWYWKEPKYRKKVEELVKAAFFTREEEGIGREVARALYGKTLENSVSRLEQFAACAFSHFLMYGLQLSPREEYVFQPMDMGNVFHKVIEIFSKRLERSEYTWFDLPKELQEAWTEECVEEVALEYGASILHSSARNEYAIRRMKRIMKRTVWALCQQVQKGNFVPSNYEVSFDMVDGLEAVNIALTQEEKMKLKGRIDRIDTCEQEEQVYVKVIDYKSGSTEFDMVALYYGLQLQLVVYLNAAVELEKRIHPQKEVVPGGIFYYRMQDPMLDGEPEESPEEINQRILKKLKLSGLVNEDPQIVKAMDRELEKDSAVIPVSYNKDGSPSRYASLASGRQFASLSGYVKEKIRQIGTEILQGEAGASPYERKGKTPCEYCDYREVCGFDPKIPGTAYRRLKEYKTQEVWEKIQEEMDGWE